jgi:F-type H+-transporting ATPase subunit delta
MESYVIAARYAKALIQVVGPDNWDKVRDEIESMNSLLGELPDLKEYLISPIISEEGKKNVLEKIIAQVICVPENAIFFLLLLKKGRLVLLPEILKAFCEIVQHMRNMETAFIRSSKQMSEEEIIKIVEKLSTMADCTLRAEVSYDPSLLCGIVAQVGHVVYDMSLKSKLEDLRNKLYTSR